MSFGENLHFLRQINNISQDEIAKLVKKNRSLISQWESNDKKPIIEDLIILSKYFNLTIEELYEKNLRVEQNVQLDENHKLDKIIMDKTVTMDENTKKMLIGIMDTINTNLDKEKNNSIKE